MARVADGLRPGGASIGRSESNKLFVGGLPRDISEEEFVRYFEGYGEIIDAVVMRIKGTGASRGFGFVQFSRASMAERVMADSRKHHIGGKWVEVKRTMPDAEINMNRSGPPRPWSGPPGGFGGKGGRPGQAPPMRYSSRSRSRRRYDYGVPPPPPPGRPPPYHMDPYAMDRRPARWPARAAPPSHDGYWGRPQPREVGGISDRLDRLRVEVARLNNNGDNQWRRSGPRLLERGGASGKGAPARRPREGDGWRQSVATRSDGKPPWATDGAADTAEDDEPCPEDERVKMDDVLPEGWEALEDEEGSMYFHHVPTGATQWECPEKDEPKEEGTMPPFEEQHQFEEEEHAAASRSVQQEDSTQSLQEEQPVSEGAKEGPEVSKDEEPAVCPEEDQAPRSTRQPDSLLTDWEEVEDVEGGVYYHHIPTGHTQWEPPRRDVPAQDLQTQAVDSSASQDARSGSHQ